MTNIAVRGRVAGSAGVVKVSLLAWEPFHPPGAGEDSFAKRYCRALLGALNPEWDIEFIEYRSLDDCLRSLTTDASSAPLTSSETGVIAQHDLAFGLYDLVTREVGGIDFVAVPGLAVNAGALCVGRNLDWFDLLSPRTEAERPVILVLPSEAGWSTLAGGSSYPRSNLRLSRFTEPSAIAGEFSKLVEDQWVRGGVPVAFVADSYTVARVAESLRQDGRVGPEVLFVEGGGEWAPRYNLGLGVRADSPRFRQLLRRATATDLFGVSVPQTARTYWNLLRTRQDDARIQLQGDTLLEFGAGKLHRFTDALVRAAPVGDETRFRERAVWSKLFRPESTPPSRQD